MLFSSIVFLFYFLPAVLVLYYLFRKWTPVKNAILLVASLIFYAWGEPWFVLIMLVSILLNYILALLVDRYRERSYVRAFLALAAVLNLGLLFVFKYLDFVLRNVGQVMNRDIPLTNLTLPIGISFFTFQALSYVVDVYRKKGRVQKNPFYVALYIAFFPQLIAGPIVQYASIDEQIVHREESWDKFSVGTCRFIAGLGKKVLLSNNFAIVADRIFDSYQMGGMPVTLAWLGSIAYTLQILFDFSGYSDMAIGLGEMFGFHFPENFCYPYESKSITEFWRRWHMTLSGWFREYLYIPLGGSKKGRGRQIVNLFIVWFLTGLWHGAGWNFILWGLYFFVLLVLEKLFLLKLLNHMPAFIQHIYALFWIIFGWVIFACDDITRLKSYIKVLMGIGSDLLNQLALYEWTTHAIFLLILAIASTQLMKNLCNRILQKLSCYIGEASCFWIKSMWCLIIFFLSIAMLVSGSYNPFLYFRF